jgi:hypothetical protein
MTLNERVRRILAPALARGEQRKIEASIDAVTENVYRSLPSGDYGRGDVRRAILQEVAQ